MKQKCWWEKQLCEIERIIGKKISPNMTFNKVPTEKIGDIRELILSSGERYENTSLNSDYRIAFLEMLNTRDTSAWLSHEYAGGPNYYKPLSAVGNDICKYLLYYDAVAVSEPLTSSVYEAQAWADTLKLSTTEASRRLGDTVLKHGLRFWARMRPLLTSGLIQTFPSSYSVPITRSPECNALCELDDNHLHVLDEAEKIVLESLPAEQAKAFCGLLGIARGEDNLNRRFFNAQLLYCDQQGYEIVFQSLFGAALFVSKGLVAGRAFKPFNFGVRQDLALSVCRLPSVAGLSAKRIIDLHGDNDTFYMWRSELEKILDTVDIENPDSFSRIAKKEITELSIHLKEKIAKHSLGSKVKTTGLSFGGGAIGTFATTGEPISSLIGGLATSSASLLLNLLFGQPAKSDVVLQHVFQLITDAESDYVPIL